MHLRYLEESSVSSWASTDELGVGLSSLSRHLDATLDLWTEMLLEPGWRQADMDRIVQRSKESLKQTKGSVASVARRLSGHVAYGGRHALGRLKTEKSYDSITVKDC